MSRTFDAFPNDNACPAWLPGGYPYRTLVEWAARQVAVGELASRSVAIARKVQQRH